MTNAMTARYHMIDGQLAPNRIVDAAIIAAMGVTPRELFVPQEYAAAAYVDDNIPLGAGRYLMRPQVLAELLQVAQITDGMDVLVVAGNTGYSSRVVAQLGAKVVMVEERRELAEKARQLLLEKGRHAIEVKMAPLVQGYASAAPYAVILIDGAVEVVPQALHEQLAEDGRLIGVRSIRRATKDVVGLGRAFMQQKINGEIFERELFDAAVPLIDAFRQPESFRF